MLVEVKIVQDDGRDLEAKERRVIHVETHSRRNDMFNVQKVDDVLEGDAVTFNIPNGGRLVINTPATNEDVVYDTDQAAAVRPSSQVNDEGKADKPDLDAIVEQKKRDAELAKKQAEDQKARDEEAAKLRTQTAPVQGTVMGAQHKPNNPAASTPNPSIPSTPAQTPPQQKKG